MQLSCPNMEYLALEDCDALKPEECSALTGLDPLGGGSALPKPTKTPKALESRKPLRRTSGQTSGGL